MTPKEKARELTHRFSMMLTLGMSDIIKKHAMTLHMDEFAKLIHEETERTHALAKKLVLAHIDEMLKLEISQPITMYGMTYVSVNDFYMQVKQEIEKF